jgi:hypothetical protein
VIARVTITAVQHGSTIQNVVHMWKPEPEPNALQLLGPSVVTNWINVVRGQQVNLLKYTNVMVQQVDPLGQGFNTATSILGNIPTGTGYPTFAAIILSFKTATPGRRGRGRVYMGGLRLDGGNNNTVEANTLLAWQTISATLKAKWTGGTPETGWNLVVIPRNDPTSHKFVIDIAPRSTFGVQRRRNTGVGI